MRSRPPSAPASCPTFGTLLCRILYGVRSASSVHLSPAPRERLRGVLIEALLTGSHALGQQSGRPCAIRCIPQRRRFVFHQSALREAVGVWRGRARPLLCTSSGGL